MNDKEITDSMENARNIMDPELHSSEEENDEVNNEGNVNETIYEKSSNIDKPKKIKLNTCECEICSKVRECINSYKNYTPVDELADRFKNSITETCNKHNLII